MTEHRMEPPRIFYGYARRLGDVSDAAGGLSKNWRSLVEQAASLGFTHVQAGLDLAGRMGQAELAPEIDAEIALLVSACKRSRLLLWLDVCLGEQASGDPLASTHADWYRPALSGQAVDPRQPPALRNKVVLRVDEGQAPASWVAYWIDALASWLDAGVSGFCFHLPQRVPLTAWQHMLPELRSRFTQARFSAWTPGVPAPEVIALGDAGFDAAFTSLAWWDYRAGWYAEEHARLRAFGNAITFPVDPFDLDEHGRLPAPVDEQAAIRACWASAASGDGWLVPFGFEQGHGFDLASQVKAANALLGKHASAVTDRRQVLTGADAPVTVLWRSMLAGEGKRARPAQALVVLVNPDVNYPSRIDMASLRARLPQGYSQIGIIPGTSLSTPLEGEFIALEPAGVRVYAASRTQPVVTVGRVTRHAQNKTLGAAMQAPRVAIEAVSPVVDDGRFALKRTLGDAVTVEADILMDGHDQVAAAVMWRAADAEDWQSAPMTKQVNDRWSASFIPERVGPHVFEVHAWFDVIGTYHSELSKKHQAGLDIALEIEEGRLLLGRILASAEANRKLDAAVLEQIRHLVTAVGDADDVQALQHLLSPATVQLVRRADVRLFLSRSEREYPVYVDRPAAHFASWYELFPRSQSGDKQRHGTFDDVIERLPAIRDMGFDVLYFPPIHPIGRKNRKGRNNSLVAQDNDPGSPYAIGAAEGGHDAIHPELGTLDDFRRLVAAAQAHDLEIALDFAIQCSPDHPWLREHPEWFAWRADGSIKYAENPPKKYEDIVNVDFYAPGVKGARESASTGLWMALRDVVLFWCKEGVRTFRVDNPHTKPLPFWEWLIKEVQGRYPDALFLSEAFTRPKMMYRLAKLGYTQSYTYFTWREHKQELIDYLVELSQPPVSDFFRPNFFVNTPDINPRFLQRSGRSGFLIRAALATTLSGLWGMYNGFELCDGTPVPGKEDYLDSEKYELRVWDYAQPGNIVAEIKQLNEIRRRNRALQTHKGIRFLAADNDSIIAYTKATPERDNVVLVVVNLDPFNTQGATVELPLWEFGQPDDGALQAEDLLFGHRFTWHGKRQFVQLDAAQPYAIWRISLNG